MTFLQLPFLRSNLPLPLCLHLEQDRFAENPSKSRLGDETRRCTSKPNVPQATLVQRMKAERKSCQRDIQPLPSRGQKLLVELVAGQIDFSRSGDDSTSLRQCLLGSDLPAIQCFPGNSRPATG